MQTNKINSYYLVDKAKEDVSKAAAAKTQEEQPETTSGNDEEALKNTPYDERDEKKEGEEEEEKEETCGFCIFMKGGGCKDTFTVSLVEVAKIDFRFQ